MPRTSRLFRTVFLLTVGVVVVIGGLGTAYAFYYNHRYLPRTVVGGVAIGGMTQSEAASALASKEAAFVRQPLTLTYEGKDWSVSPAELGTSVVATSQLNQLWNEEKGGGFGSQLKKLFAAPLSSRYADVSFTAVTPDGQKALQEKVLKNIETVLQETTLSFSTVGATLVPGKPGQKFDETSFESGLSTAFKTDTSTIALNLEPAVPEVTPAMAGPALSRANAILSKPLSVSFGTQTFTVDPGTFATWLSTTVARTSAGIATGLDLNLTGKATDAMKEWEGKVNKSPVNVRLVAGADGKATISQSDVDGSQIDEAQTAQALAGYLDSDKTDDLVSGTVVVKKAEVNAGTLASLGLTELVGTATTNFSGSPVNRVFNIKKGAASINQVLIKPGDTFSTLDTLGPITTESGYLNELVIKDNRTVLDAGGGLCQVSTTLFRSVLNAGMPIVERQNHAYRVSYYEVGVGPGLDATIFEPAPDFKWKNDFTTAMFVQSTVVGNLITFDLYGTKDGRVSTIGKPNILAIYPVGDPIYANTDSLPTEVTKQVEHPHDGAKTSVDYTVTRSGKQIYSKTFISVYKAWPAQFLVGTGAAPPDPAVGTDAGA